MTSLLKHDLAKYPPPGAPKQKRVLKIQQFTEEELNEVWNRGWDGVGSGALCFYFLADSTFWFLGLSSLLIGSFVFSGRKELGVEGL